MVRSLFALYVLAANLGSKTVAVYSEADKEALHAELADEAICIGPAKAADSYLNVQQILSAAIVTKAEAIHPGFGSYQKIAVWHLCVKNAILSLLVLRVKTIDAMGNKINARRF